VRQSVALALLLGTTIGYAYDADMVSKAMRNCNANQQSQNVCAWHRAELAEKEMQQTLSQLQSQLQGTGSAAALESAQTAWLAYRTRECAYRISGLTPDGSMRGQWQDSCRQSLTDARNAELKRHLNCRAQGCPGQ
jgi:uncharacterized protein YecT (DUF1311 family)